MAVLAAVIRGFARAAGRRSATSGRTSRGRCSTSCSRSSFIGALILVSQGVSRPSAASDVTTLAGGDQTLALGPAASQIAIKQLGTNGGGFFNVNSAMPFENPTAFSNFVELLFILLIPAALTAHVRAHGRQPPPGLGAVRRDAGDVRRRHRRSPTPPSSTARRRSTRPACTLPPVDGTTGGNMEGKEQRFGIANSAALGDRHDRRLQRLGQLRARVLHRDRRRGAAGQHDDRRGDLRRASAPASTGCCCSSCWPSSSPG